MSTLESQERAARERAARAQRGTARRGDATRERLVAATLLLLNEHGPERVTTARVAEAGGVNEGNLYYHFRTKEALLLEVFGRFEAEAEALLARPWTERDSLSPYLDRLREWFGLVWRYRFLYRDAVGVLAAAPALRRRIRRVSARLRNTVTALLRDLRDAGLIALPEDDVPTLLANVWIVSTYWAVYLDIQEGVRTLRRAHLEWAFRQVAALYRPYLTPPARAWLEGNPEALFPTA